MSALSRMGIFTWYDVLNHFPRTYEDFSLVDESSLVDKQRIVIKGNLASLPVYKHFGKMNLVSFRFISSFGHEYEIAAFNRPYLLKSLSIEDTYTLVGVYDIKRNSISLSNLVKGEMEIGKLKPIYSLDKEIENYMFIALVKKAFLQIPTLGDSVPFIFKNKYHLLNKIESLHLIHQPASYKDIISGYRLFKYEECLMFSLRTQLIREENKLLGNKNNIRIDIDKLNTFISSLPYKLTSSQDKVVKEILDDMNKPSLMNRLLQGDVGSGKTIVSLLAMYSNFLRNEQSAFMAPTDALARQHYLTLTSLLKNTLVKVELLLGSTSNKEKEDIKKRLANHDIDIVVGTHALFTSNVIYSQLGLVVIDEQHRFGVNQRYLLASKGEGVDLLLMSATPIPRTLAFSLYGDLDVSTLDEFPYQTKQVETKIISSNLVKITLYIDKSLSDDKRVFIIAPLIEGEENEKSVTYLYQEYQKKYFNKVAFLHGKMDSDEKEKIIEDFKEGIKPILVSTTVIEVGIDVKKANLMIIYSASSFGLASLHQLRGRIGRDGSKAICLLVNDEEEENERLKTLVKSNDGFEIARVDLSLRGPGQFSGLKQSGLPDFRYANIIKDIKIFEVAREDAKYIISQKDDKRFTYILSRAKSDIDPSTTF